MEGGFADQRTLTQGDSEELSEQGCVEAGGRGEGLRAENVGTSQWEEAGKCILPGPSEPACPKLDEDSCRTSRLQTCNTRVWGVCGHGAWLSLPQPRGTCPVHATAHHALLTRPRWPQLSRGNRGTVFL